MADTEHHLFLTTEDPYATYAPGDKVCGTANLEIVNPLLAKYVIVSLLAGHRVTAAEAKPSKQNFFHKQFTIPFHNKREDPARTLSSGKHKWKFEFTLPRSNELPPSFCYRDELGSAEVLYCLVMCVYTTDSTCPSKETMCTLPIKYTPKRSPSISIESSASYVCQHLLVKLPDGGVFPARRKHSAFQIVKQIINRQKPAEELLHATLWLPRYAAFNDHMDVSLKIQTHDEDPLRYVQVRLVKIEYLLWATTRIGSGQGSRVRRHKMVGTFGAVNTLLDTNSLWTSLRRHAPFRVQPRLHGLPLDKNSFSSLSPSFAYQNIVREYTLDIDLFISVYGVVHRVRFEGNELVLLPHELHLDND